MRFGPEGWGKVHATAGEAPSGGGPGGPWSAGVWLNAPRRFGVDGDALDLVTDPRTDFWRETFYGFTRDSGHFLGLPAPDGFTAELRVQGRYETLYDQAGLMVRLDAHRWLKAGLEWSDGQAMLSSVLTDGRSDWATAPYAGDPADFRLRVTVSAGVLRLQVSADGEAWPLVRLAPFPIAERYHVGPMACTPERDGLHVRFSAWRLGPALAKPLHDLS